MFCSIWICNVDIKLPVSLFDMDMWSFNLVLNQLELSKLAIHLLVLFILLEFALWVGVFFWTEVLLLLRLN
jgi:hypothetical protein